MIEINLVPDVKLELIRVRRVRNLVISSAIIVSVAVGSITALMAAYVFGGQAFQKKSSEDTIAREMKKLESHRDLSKLLTIQNQLASLKTAHDQKLISSRIFDLMATVLPTDKNKVSMMKVDLNAADGTITVEGEAENGFESLEVFKKTLAVTKLVYLDTEDRSAEALVASNIIEGDRNYGERIDGKKILRFSLTFTYDSSVFSPTIKNASFVGPEVQNATDSRQGVPADLFADTTTRKEDN